MLDVYIPIFVMIVIAAIIAIVFFGLSKYMGSRRAAEEKQGTYESGMIPFGDSRIKFSMKFYLTAMSFIIFDVEALFLYPWAVNLTNSNSIAFLLCGLLFLVILFIGYFWELKKGGYEWD